MNYESVALWSEVISAAAFVAALIWVWAKYIQPAVTRAQENANARIAEAERHRDEAKAQLERLERSIADAQRDAAAIKERVREQASGETQAIVGEARDAGERALRNARGELDRARAAARVTYRDELLESALQQARAEAAERVDDRVNRELLAGFLTSLEHGGRN